MDMAISGVRPRRTQAQRRAATRRRLLDAALDSLVDVGYAGTTTTLVSQRAGVSRGAQLHHFPSRAVLMAAAVEHLFERMRSEYQAAFAEFDAADIARAVDLLWSMFERPHFAAVLELYMAARTDSDLRVCTLEVAERHQQHVFRLAREYYPELAGGGDLNEVLQTILDAMHGMAVSRFLMGTLDDREQRLSALRRLAARAVVSSVDAAVQGEVH